MDDERQEIINRITAMGLNASFSPYRENEATLKAVKLPLKELFKLWKYLCPGIRQEIVSAHRLEMDAWIESYK